MADRAARGSFARPGRPSDLHPGLAPSVNAPLRLSIARVAALVGAERTIVFATFAGLVLLMWLPFGLRSGLGYETAFPLMSERESWWDGFFYDADPLRPYTNVFYHLSYLLGETAGVTGSFVPYQVVYAALWFGRGALAYEIVRRLAPDSGQLPFLAGGLVLVHASDGALNWVGQMNQFGMIFWLLFSVYFLLLAVTVESPWWGAAWCVLSMVGVRLCLWSYESAVGLVLLAPAIVLIVRQRSLTRVRISYALLYYVPALYYAWLNIDRYANGDGTSYQEGVVRSDVAIGQLLDDLAFNVDASLRFWGWDDSPPAPGVVPALVGLIAASVVIVGGVGVHRVARRGVVPDRRLLASTALVGLLLLVASFPAYLFLDSARSLWRTQFLAGIGFGIAIAAAICLAVTVLSGRRWRATGALTLCAVVAYFGAVASYGVARYHYQYWDRHRDAVAEVLEIAPRLKPNSVVVYMGVPHSADPFGDTLWFDFALKLAYPGVAVAGEYFFDDGTPAPGANLTYRQGRWMETGNGMPPGVHDANLSNTLFVLYGRHGSRLSARPPASFGTPARTSTAYRPRRLIERGPPDRRAVRRYGPLDAMRSPVNQLPS